jgi:hypothetical protein
VGPTIPDGWEGPTIAVGWVGPTLAVTVGAGCVPK